MAKRKTTSIVMKQAVQKIPESAFKRYYGDLRNTVIFLVEKNLIETILNNTDYNMVQTAKWLGVARNTLRTRIREYRIKIKRKKKVKKKKSRKKI